MTEQPSGFEVTVEGDYFVTDGRNKGLKRYIFNFKIPSMDSALSVIKNKVLDMVLKKKYSDYISYRTYIITKVTPFGTAKISGAFDLWSSSRDEVERYIRKSDMLVVDGKSLGTLKVKFYPTLMGLREAVQLAEADPDRFLLNQAKLEKDFIFTESLRALNPEMYEENEDAPTEDLLNTL